MIQLIVGIIFILYDILLLCVTPGTFLDNLTSFTHIWSAAGILLIYSSLYRRRHGDFFWKKWKRWLQRTVAAVLGLCVVISIINLCFILNPKTCKMEEERDYLILLGGGIDKNGKLPSSVMKRVERAGEYLKAHPNTICVPTGGTLKWLPYAEAPEIKRQLVLMGIDESRILIEDQALDTIQNLEYSCELLAESQGVQPKDILQSRVLLVSSRFHLRRAERLAARLGYSDVSGIGSATPPYALPHSYLREICAYVKLNLRILLTGKPNADYFN